MKLSFYVTKRKNSCFDNQETEKKIFCDKKKMVSGKQRITTMIRVYLL